MEVRRWQTRCLVRILLLVRRGLLTASSRGRGGEGPSGVSSKGAEPTLSPRLREGSTSWPRRLPKARLLLPSRGGTI